MALSPAWGPFIDFSLQYDPTHVMNSIISLPWRTKTGRFLIASVDGRKRFETYASVKADISIRFRWTKNGGIQQRLSARSIRPRSHGNVFLRF